MAPACAILGITEKTFQNWIKTASTGDKRPLAVRPEPANKLSIEERQQVLKLAHSEEFQSLPPSQIVPTLADRGEYIASESTMYRVLREADEQHHRGRSCNPCPKPKATHSASKPNQVWCWDITYLPGPIKGLFFFLYLILDIYTREIVGWEIWPEESADNASILIRRATMARGINRQEHLLVLHSDNGSPMKGATMLETLYMLGIIPSRSRPRVSNDNPYAESVFRTCKYRPGYPSNGFDSIESAREWVFAFVKWYNYEHKHSGLNFLTPNQRYCGGEQVLEQRKAVYEAARAKHPERWSKQVRDWSLSDTVWLNPDKIKDEGHCQESEKGA